MDFPSPSLFPEVRRSPVPPAGLLLFRTRCGPPCPLLALSGLQLIAREVWFRSKSGMPNQRMEVR